MPRSSRSKWKCIWQQRIDMSRIDFVLHVATNFNCRSIRQHTSAYTSAYVSIRQFRAPNRHQLQMPQHAAAYVSIRQHTSAYVSVVLHVATSFNCRRFLRQYLYFCTSTASKLSTCRHNLLNNDKSSSSCPDVTSPPEYQVKSVKQVPYIYKFYIYTYHPHHIPAFTTPLHISSKVSKVSRFYI